MSTAAPQENAAAATPKRSGSSPFRRRPREEAHSNEVLDHGGLPMTIAGYAAMMIAFAIVAIPLYWIFMTSIKHRSDIYTTPAVWFPHSVTGEGYKTATQSIPFWDFFRNSVIVTVIPVSYTHLRAHETM